MSRYCAWRTPTCAIRHGIFLADPPPFPTGQCKLRYSLVLVGVLPSAELAPVERLPRLPAGTPLAISEPDLDPEYRVIPRFPSASSLPPDTSGSLLAWSLMGNA